MQSLPKVLVILGPTASGKTAWGVRLAKKFNGEIISADSRQVYRGMDIGTGKDLDEYSIEVKNQNSGVRRIKIPYHLIDVVEPDEQYSVGRWKKEAEEAIADILKRGRLPIVVGGTGLYIDSLTKGLDFPKAEADLDLRKKLEKMGKRELLAKLKELDLKTYKEIDKKNRRRVERAVEVCLATGRPFSEQRKKISPKYEFLQIGIQVDRDKIRKKILNRLLHRFDKEEMVAEVERLHQEGVSWERLDDFGLEYRFISEYLRGKMEYEEMREKLFYASSQFAKRQMTWFKRDRRIKWVKEYIEAEEMVGRFIIRN